MIEVDIIRCQRAVQEQHECMATFFQSMPVKETFDGKTVCEDVVHVLPIRGCPQADKAYTWLSPMEGSEDLRYFAVLHDEGRITSPEDAVRAVIVREKRNRP